MTSYSWLHTWLPCVTTNDGTVPVIPGAWLAKASPLLTLVGLVDAFDAMCSHRPYREPFTVGEACDTIRAERGRQFDHHLADVLLSPPANGPGDPRAHERCEQIRDSANARYEESDTDIAVEACSMGDSPRSHSLAGIDKVAVLFVSSPYFIINVAAASVRSLVF